MKAKKIVLALGESTNTHILESKESIEYSFSGTDESVIEFRTKGRSVIKHEEHDRIVLPEGKYLKVSQSEYDPFANKIRQVYD